MPKQKSIWFKAFPLARANEMSQDCMIGRLGIEFMEAGADYLKGRMPVDNRTRQPMGILHGGASLAFAETLASWAATYVVDPSKYHCVGLEVNANHLRPISDGFVFGLARPIHLGRSTQVWEVRIGDERDKLVCIARVTMAVLGTSDHPLPPG